jgi:hypothetical protein
MDGARKEHGATLTPIAFPMRFLRFFGILQKVPRLVFLTVGAALARARSVERKLFVLIGKNRLFW